MNQSQKMSLDNEERKNKVINENSEKKKEQYISDHKEDIDADADANKKIYKESVSTNKSTQTDKEATSFRSILQSKVWLLLSLLLLLPLSED